MPLQVPTPPESRGLNERLRLGAFVLDLSAPKVMGILNVTPDSFSDGGLFSDPARAEDHAFQLEAEGAHLLDIGGESSRPGSEPVSAEEELRRVLPVLIRLKGKLKIPISLDTYKYKVMERVLDLGVSMINDIYALRKDPRAPRLLNRYGAGVVLMHLRGDPKTMQADVAYEDLLDEVASFLQDRTRWALERGIDRDRILIDPGIGFGKSAEGNEELLHSIDVLKQTTGFPVLVGLSRKSFLRRFVKNPEDLATLNAAAHALALVKGVDVLRVHEVSPALRVVEWLSRWTRHPEVQRSFHPFDSHAWHPRVV